MNTTIIQLPRLAMAIGISGPFKIETEVTSIRQVYSLSDATPLGDESRRNFQIATSTVMSIESFLTYDEGEETVEMLFFTKEVEIPSIDGDALSPIGESPVFLSMDDEVKQRLMRRVAIIHDKTAERTVILSRPDYAESVPTQDAISELDEKIEKAKRNIAIILKKHSQILHENLTLVQLEDVLPSMLPLGADATDFIDKLREEISNSYTIHG